LEEDGLRGRRRERGQQARQGPRAGREGADGAGVREADRAVLDWVATHFLSDQYLLKSLIPASFSSASQSSLSLRCRNCLKALTTPRSQTPLSSSVGIRWLFITLRNCRSPASRYSRR